MNFMQHQSTSLSGGTFDIDHDPADSDTSGYSSDPPSSKFDESSDDALEKMSDEELLVSPNEFGVTGQTYSKGVANSAVALALQRAKLESQKLCSQRNARIRQIENQSQLAQDQAVNAAIANGKTKREIRKLKNRLSAVRSRQRKEAENENCRIQVNEMDGQIRLYERRIQELMGENAALRRAQCSQNKVDWSHCNMRNWKGATESRRKRSGPKVNVNSRCSTVFEPAEFGRTTAHGPSHVTAISGTPLLETRATCLKTPLVTTSQTKWTFCPPSKNSASLSPTTSNLASAVTRGWTKTRGGRSRAALLAGWFKLEGHGKRAGRLCSI